MTNWSIHLSLLNIQSLQIYEHFERISEGQIDRNLQFVIIPSFSFPKEINASGKQNANKFHKDQVDF